MLRKDPFASREEQIAELIRQLIKDKRLMKGDQLPTVQEMSKQFSVSKDMVSAALELLSYEGAVLIKPRYGSFVADNMLTGRLDWNEITGKSAYTPSAKKLTDLYSMVDYKKESPNISMLTISDGIYHDLLRNAGEKTQEAITKTNYMELYLHSGLDELKENLAKHMARYGMDVDPRQILICAHMPDALGMVVNLLLRHGTAFLYEMPSMSHHRSYIRSVGGVQRGLDMDDEGIIESALLKEVSGNKNAIFCTSPLYSFPTGISASLSRKKNILKICTNANVPIIEIDDFRDFDVKAPPPYFSMSQSENVIYIGSLSRTLPFGLPLSWIVLPFRLVGAVNDLQFQYNWGPGTYIQMFINEMLKDGSYYEYLDRLMLHIKDRHGFSHSIVEKYLGDIAKISDRHLMCYWAELPVSNETMSAQKHIRLALGSIYSSKTPNHIVISKTFPEKKKYEEGIRALREFIDKIML